tara:strand:- start:399 stop:611 length:213 start_codon:yes stop_codon:yes gene_type:complete
MKIKELSGMGKNQLVEKLREFEKELMKLRMQVASGTPPESPGKIRALRRSIARIKTLQNQNLIKKDGGGK